MLDRGLLKSYQLWYKLSVRVKTSLLNKIYNQLDFDDAVYAEPTANGWKLVVAIADVSHYVEEGTALDIDAIERGNSVYFPRRVVPMLPEAISNGLCSINPDVERLCMTCEMNIDSEGNLIDYKFYSAVMFS
jgi:ribonuclease R